MKNLTLAQHLRQTIDRLRSGAPYQWTHQGRCNLGHLIQSVTGLDGADIHRMAIRSEGDWRDHAATYCPNSGVAVDTLIGAVLRLGMRLEDLGDFERLSSPRVLRWLPANRRSLDHRRRDDVILYLDTWAQLLDAEQTHRLDPHADNYVNGRRYVPPPKASQLLNAIDENPAAGRAA
ncbi:MAG: hypothetical protein VX589_21505 [Myxococcota bacterium]|nr:hypothetical protein [Myxococcota bacterium]